MADEMAARTDARSMRADAAAADAGSAPMVNRRRRGILGGAVLIAVGVTYLLPVLGVPDATSYLFISLGTAFAVAYVTGLNAYVYLVPAAVLFSFGGGLLIPRWLGLAPDPVANAAIFLASLTIGLVGVFIIRPVRRWPLVPAAVFGVVALAVIFHVTRDIPPGLQALFVPAILIAVGAYLIFAPRL